MSCSCESTGEWIAWQCHGCSFFLHFFAYYDCMHVNKLNGYDLWYCLLGLLILAFVVHFDFDLCMVFCLFIYGWNSKDFEFRRRTSTHWSEIVHMTFNIIYDSQISSICQQFSTILPKILASNFQPFWNWLCIYTNL